MNSKMFAVATAALVCASSVIAAEYEGDAADAGTGLNNNRTTPLQVGIADPLVLPGADYDVRGLRFSLFYGSSKSLTGLDLSLVGLVREETAGLSLGGFSWVDGGFYGVQASLVANIDCSDSAGIAFAAVNGARSAMTGVQLGLVNCSGNFTGVQWGLVNWDNGYSAGLQLGLVNADLSEFAGCSAGLVNCVESFVGLQCGLLNIATKTARGVQFGLFNAADKYVGVQVGLLNLIGNAAIPVLPIVNANF